MWWVLVRVEEGGVNRRLSGHGVYQKKKKPSLFMSSESKCVCQPPSVVQLNVFPTAAFQRAKSSLEVLPCGTKRRLHLVSRRQSLVLLPLYSRHDLARVLHGTELEIPDALPRSSRLRRARVSGCPPWEEGRRGGGEEGKLTRRPSLMGMVTLAPMREDLMCACDSG